MLNPDYLSKLGIENIVNYNRKSRQDEELEKRTGEDTLKSIRDLMDRVLAPLGIPYDQEDEIGSGDKISSRPVFQDVLVKLREGKYQAIAVKEITRMGRGSYTDMGVIYDLIVDKCIFIITPWKVYDPRNNADLRQIRFELFLSREEFETTRERLTGGRYNKALEGRWMAGKPPFGYDLNKKTRKLTVNQDEATIVRLVYDLYVNGIAEQDGTRRDVGHRALCTYLTRNGVPSPSGSYKWYTSVLRYMLVNEVYLGTMIYGATKGGNRKQTKPIEEQIIVEHAHPAIIDAETWAASKEKDDASKVPESQKSKVKLDFVPSELTGLIVCKVCGNRMLKQFTKQRYTRKKDNVQMEYTKEFLWCRNPGCTFVKYRAIEEDLLFTMRHLVSLDKASMETTLQQLADQETKKRSNEDDLKVLHEKKLQDLMTRRSFILEKYESGMYSDELYRERMEEVEKRISELNKSAQETEISYVKSEARPDISLIQGQISSLVDTYTNATNTALKNEILRKVFSYVVVEVIEKGRGSIPAKHKVYPALNPQIASFDFLVV
ncbi:recombinase family protein [Cohnella yongneupensis]|uniref:Recombinase family protein n=1 Tax=Cohnella yongneupensis TaxID=425006 RepID=A0ABW0QVP0_9BACL